MSNGLSENTGQFDINLNYKSHNAEGLKYVLILFSWTSDYIIKTFWN